MASLRSQFDDAESRMMTGCEAAAVTRHSPESTPKSLLFDVDATMTCLPANACVNLGKKLPLLRTIVVDAVAGDEETINTLFPCCDCWSLLLGFMDTVRGWLPAIITPPFRDVAVEVVRIARPFVD